LTHEIASIPPELVNAADCMEWLAFYESLASAGLSGMAGNLLRLSLLEGVKYFELGAALDSASVLPPEADDEVAKMEFAGADTRNNYFWSQPAGFIQDARLLRVTAGLKRDPIFGSAATGEVEIRFGEALPHEARTWAAGPVLVHASDRHVYLSRSFADADGSNLTLIARLHADGAMDSGFGAKGFVTVWGNAQVLSGQADGSVLLTLDEPGLGQASLRLLGSDRTSPGAVSLVGVQYPRMVWEGRTEHFRLVRSLGSDGPVRVSAALISGAAHWNGSATAGNDYEDQDPVREFSWTDGQTGFASFNVPIRPDEREPDEYFRVRLHSVDGGAALFHYEEALRIPGDLQPGAGPPVTSDPPPAVAVPVPPEGGGGAVEWSVLAAWGVVVLAALRRRMPFHGRFS
jgi:hypothetical protein